MYSGANEGTFLGKEGRVRHCNLFLPYFLHLSLGIPIEVPVFLRKAVMTHVIIIYQVSSNYNMINVDCQSVEKYRTLVNS